MSRRKPPAEQGRLEWNGETGTRAPVVHWTRPLKDGRVEFFMRAHGQTLSGTGSQKAYEFLRAKVWLPGELPEPEIKGE